MAMGRGFFDPLKSQVCSHVMEAMVHQVEPFGITNTIAKGAGMGMTGVFLWNMLH